MAQSTASVWGARLQKAAWAVAAVAGALCLVGLAAHLGARLVLAPDVFDTAVLAALIATTLALAIAPFLAPRGRKAWPIVRLLAVPPALALGLAIALFLASPSPVNRVKLADGRQFMLAIGNTPTDVDYQLFQSADPLGAFWRRAGDLTYSEDGGFTEDPALVVSPDGRWLLVRRGGLWTDCYETTHPIRSCPGTWDLPDWRRPDDWIAHSATIAAVTGLTPPAPKLAKTSR